MVLGGVATEFDGRPFDFDSNSNSFEHRQSAARRLDGSSHSEVAVMVAAFRTFNEQVAPSYLAAYSSLP